MRSITLRRGEAIRIGAISGSACAYLAIEGGFAIEPVLGSLSTDIRSRIGGIAGRALTEGDLPSAPLRAGERHAGACFRVARSCDAQSACESSPGPQRDFFTDAEFEAFTQAGLRRRRQFQPHGLASRRAADRA